MDRMLTRLVRMPYWEAHNHLMSLDLPVDIRTALMAKANDERMKLAKDGKIAKLIHIHHAELWYRLLAPLKYELSNAKVGLRLKPITDAPERHKAFSEYVTLLEKLLSGLLLLQSKEADEDNPNNPRTPAELAADRELPNKGAHWTDWVADKTKNRIELLFHAIPYASKAKRAEPFKRRIPPDMFKRDVSALQSRTFKELDILRQEIKIARKVDCMTEEQRKHLDALEQKEDNIMLALGYMMHQMRNEPVPMSWHSIVTDGNTAPIEQDAEAQARAQIQAPERKPKKTNRPKRYRKGW